MTNCYFQALKSALKGADFYAHFPASEFPPDIFAPYFQSVAALGKFLVRLANILKLMYGYFTWEDGYEIDPETKKEVPKKVKRYHVSSHVLLDGKRVSDRQLGEFIENLVSNQVKIEDMIQQGYYSSHHGDGFLILICEFTGLMVHSTIPSFRFKKKEKEVTEPSKTTVYSRLNTPCASSIYFQFGQKGIGCHDGHATFVKRENKPMKPCKRKFTP